jgi:hypothetical protein
MELDESGYPQPTGRFETLAADTVILALGQESDTAFLREVPGVEFEPDGTVVVSSSFQTGCPGVFAGGDMVPSERTVTVAIGHGTVDSAHGRLPLPVSGGQQRSQPPQGIYPLDQSRWKGGVERQVAARADDQEAVVAGTVLLGRQSDPDRSRIAPDQIPLGGRP